MNTAFNRLPPSEAWEEAQNRSLAIGIAGCVVAGWGFTSCRGNPDTLPSVISPCF